MIRLLVALGVLLCIAAEPKKSYLNLKAELTLSDPATVLEIEIKGKLEKFKVEEIEKIEKALDSADYYINTLILKNGKLTHITFKVKPKDDDADKS